MATSCNREYILLLAGVQVWEKVLFGPNIFLSRARTLAPETVKQILFLSLVEDLSLPTCIQTHEYYAGRTAPSVSPTKIGLCEAIVVLTMSVTQVERS